MAEFYKKNEEERKKATEWLTQFRPNFESTMSKIEKYQERKLFNLEIVALILFGAFLVNVLSTSLFDLSISLTSSVGIDRLILDAVISAISLLSIIGIFLFFRKQLLKYQPQTPVMTLIVKPEDTKPFLLEERYNDMMQFLDDGKLTNFKSFASAFFDSFKVDFKFLFREAVDNPIKEYEEASNPQDTLHKGFVIMAKDYDLSNISSTGVKTKLQVKLSPHVIFSFTQQGDKTASYSFYLSFHFIILNPEHCDASKLLESYYLYNAKDIVTFASYSIDSAFKKTGLPLKLINNKKTVQG